jgi:membrane protein
MTSYNAIYGSFAALPLFMLWIQISWTICLFGAELSYISQNLDYYDYDAHPGEISHRYQLMLSAIIMARVCKRFADGRRAYTAEELQKETGIPVRVMNALLFNLIDSGLIIEVTSDEKGDSSQYVPAESLANLNLGVMTDRLEARGSWTIDLPVSELLGSEWGKAIDMRRTYLKSLYDIKLEELIS